jgi:hypothetical protein
VKLKKSGTPCRRTSEPFGRILRKLLGPLPQKAIEAPDWRVAENFLVDKAGTVVWVLTER